MVRRFFWIGVGLMLTGVLTTTIALGQSPEATEEPALVPTLTETPTLMPEVVQPTLELPTTEPVVVQPEVIVDPGLPTIDPLLVPSATLDPAIMPTTEPVVVQPEVTADLGLPTTDLVLLPTSTLDPAIMPTTEPVVVQPEVTVDPALPTFDPALLSTAVPASPTPSTGSSLSGGDAAPVVPTVDEPLQVTPIDVNVPNVTAAPTEPATLAPIDIVQTAVATQTTVIEATAIVPDATVVPTQAVTATGQVAGVVNFEHLQQHAGIRLTLQLPDGTTTNLASDDQGRFAFTNLHPGGYILQASSHGFLTIRVEFALTDGQQMSVPNGLLKRGDTNEDNLVDLRDVALIAANFNGPAAVSETDLNGDGWVDISDLSLAGALFGTTGPLAWH